MMREFVVDLTRATTFDEFVAAFNDGFCRLVDGHWHGRSWDAFHDYLSWPEEERFRLVLRGWESCGGLTSDERKMIRNVFIDNPHVDVVFA